MLQLSPSSGLTRGDGSSSTWPHSSVYKLLTIKGKSSPQSSWTSRPTYCEAWLLRPVGTNANKFQLHLWGTPAGRSPLELSLFILYSMCGWYLNLPMGIRENDGWKNKWIYMRVSAFYSAPQKLSSAFEKEVARMKGNQSHAAYEGVSKSLWTESTRNIRLQQ
jgi:hypothetical protein